MTHEIKQWHEATNSPRLKELIQSHVKEMAYNEEAKHLVIYVDNAAALHAFEDKDMDEHVQSSLEKIYDPNSTYEFKLAHGKQGGSRENAVPHNVR